MNKSVSTESGVLVTPPMEYECVPASKLLDSADRKSFQGWLVFGLILPLLSMLPFLYLQGQRLIVEPSLLFFPFSTAMGIGLLFWTCDYRPASFLRSRIAVVLIWCGMALSVLGIYLYSPALVQVASVMVIFGWSLGTFGGSRWTRVFAICCLFAISVPLPNGQNTQINLWLQSVSSWACNGFLDAIGVPNILEGNVLQVMDKKISVSEVCGGADSVYSLMALGLAIIVFRRCSLLEGLVTLASIPLLSIMGNIIRLLAIAIGFQYFEIDLTTGIGHVAIAITVFAVSVAAMLLLHVSIVAIFEPMPESPKLNKLSRYYRRVASWPQAEEMISPIDGQGWQGQDEAKSERSSLVSLGLPNLVCVLFGALSAYAVFIKVDDIEWVFLSEEQATAFPAEDAFPNQFSGLQKISFSPSTRPSTKTTGRYSHLWKFDDRGNQVFVALDFQFQGWHPLWTVYQFAGWKIMETNPVALPDESVNPWTIEEFKMQNQYGLFGYVWFAFFDTKGVPIEKPSKLEQPSRINIFQRLQNNLEGKLRSSYRVQVFFESGRELSEPEIERNQKLFFEIFERIRQQSETALKKAK